MKTGKQGQVLGPFLEVPGPRAPTWKFRTVVPPPPPPSSYAMKEPPLEPGQTLAGADRQEKGRCVTAQRETCVKGGGERGQVLGRGSRSQRGQRKPRLNRARCRGGRPSSYRLRRGVCSSWPSSGSPGGEWALPAGVEQLWPETVGHCCSPVQGERRPLQLDRVL